MVSAASFTPLSLRAQDLGCDRGGHPVFRGVSLTLNPGEALILRGDNGAGKTSLLRVLAGLTPHCEGDLETCAQGGQWQQGTALGQIAWQGHADAHKLTLSVEENLAFWARVHGLATNLDDVLGEVGLSSLAHMQTGQLSAGQRRRLALARLLIQNQPVWLLDEPTASLDTNAAQMSQALTSAHLHSGGIAVIATHSHFAPAGKVSELNLVAAA